MKMDGQGTKSEIDELLEVFEPSAEKPVGVEETEPVVETQIQAEGEPEVTPTQPESAPEPVIQGEQPAEQETLEQVNARLLAQLESMAQVQNTQAVAEKPVVETKPVETALPVQTQMQSIPVVTADDYEEALGSAAGFQKVMEKVHTSATMSVLTRLPDIVTSLVSEQVTIQNMVSDFYKVNNDLLPYRNFVGFVTNELSGKHPDWDYRKLFEEVETETRSRLNIMKQKAQREVKAPVVAPTTSARQPASAPLSDMEKQIADLIDFGND
jgi:hypothetical protein